MMDGVLGRSPGSGNSEDAVQEEAWSIRYSYGGVSGDPSTSGTGQGKEGAGQANWAPSEQCGEWWPGREGARTSVCMNSAKASWQHSQKPASSNEDRQTSSTNISLEFEPCIAKSLKGVAVWPSQQIQQVQSFLRTLKA